MPLLINNTIQILLRGYVMKTEVEMKRLLFGHEISQKSKSEFFSATDLVRAGNEWRVRNGYQPFVLPKWFMQKNVKEFISEMQGEFGKVKISARGRGTHTWVHPYLFIKIALALNPKLEIKVYKWLYDYLLKYRNDSGDSYKKMCGSISKNIVRKTETQSTIKETAKKIKSTLGVEDWNSATEERLKLRDKIHENISLLADYLPIDQAVENGISKALEEGN
jgi:hypothetical protein